MIRSPRLPPIYDILTYSRAFVVPPEQVHEIPTDIPIPDDFFALYRDSAVAVVFPTPTSPFRINFAGFSVTLRGCSERLAGLWHYTAQPGTVEIAPPYQLMGTLGRSPDYEAITFACGPALLRQTLASGVGLAALPCFALDARPYIQVPPAQFEPLQHLALAIEAEWEGQATHWQDVIRSYLHALILQVSRHYAEQVTQLRRSPASRYALAARFQAVVEQRFVEILDGGTPDLTLISSYAQELGIDESYLGETIRHVFGRSPSELIRERLLLEARYLVRYSTLTISEIADRLGFRDVSYFSRWFKQRTGVAPVHYRG